MPTERQNSKTRDAAFDLLRAVALVRIVFWHLFAQKWMTWIAAIPVMFFVAGSMLERPGRHRVFLYRRLRRILLPLWVYASVVALTCAWTGHLRGASAKGIVRALTWVVPVVDPTSTGWDGGWLSNHLWYLRAYVWMLLLAPLVIRLSKRLGVAAVGVVTGVIALEVAARFHVPLLGSGPVRLVLGDAVAYGFFAVLGVWYSGASVKPAARRLLLASIACTSAAIAFAFNVGLPSEGVNGSYPAILLVGGAWLALIGAGERWIRDLADRPFVRRVSNRISSRSLSVYLWHPACIVVARRLVVIDGILANGLLIIATLVLVIATVGIVGWVETIASHRAPSGERLNRRNVLRSALASVVIAAAAVPLVGAHATALSAAGESGNQSGTTVASAFVVGIPAPSARDALSDAAFAATPADRSDEVATTVAQPTDAEPFAFESGVPVAVSSSAWSKSDSSSTTPSSSSVPVLRSTVPPAMLALVRPAKHDVAPPSTVTSTKRRTASRTDLKSHLSDTGVVVQSAKAVPTTQATSVPKSRAVPKTATTGARNRAVAPKTPPSLSVPKPSTRQADKSATTVAPAPTGAESITTSSSTATTSVAPTTRPTTTASASARPASPAPAVADESVDSPGRLNEADLQHALDAWRATASPRPKTMVLALKSGTQTWVAKSPDGGVAFQEPEAVFGIASLTKTFTAALVLREVEKGTIGLDTPAPAVKGLEVPVPPGVTVRRLLTHTTGLVDYNEAPGYHAWEPMTALKAVALSFAAPQKDGLGLTVRYANSNYLYLGLLLEQVTGTSYRELVAGLVSDAGLQHTTVDLTPQNGWVGFSSGGIASTLADLATWGQALFTPGTVLSAHGVSLMTTLGDMNLGLGAWPMCPCWTDNGGTKRYTAIGHNTATGGMFYFPATGITLVAMFEGATNDMVSLMNALTKAMSNGS